AYDRTTQVTGQIVPDQNQAEWRQRRARVVSQPGRPLRSCRALRSLHWYLWQLSEQLKHFTLQPGMQHDVRRVGHALSAHLAGRRAEQRQQFGRATTNVLVRLVDRLS